jgi:hypothetical protein
MASTEVILCIIFNVPPHGLSAFQTYEDTVLPLLTGHGGILERRLRSADGLTEIHVVKFPSAAHVDSYRADPRRSAHSHLFEASNAVSTVLEVTEV